jgi:hypothetical protein
VTETYRLHRLPHKDGCELRGILSRSCPINDQARLKSRRNMGKGSVGRYKVSSEIQRLGAALWSGDRHPHRLIIFLIYIDKFCRINKFCL